MKTFIVLLLFTNLVVAQKKEPINYLNQTSPGNTPVLFAKGSISSDLFEHSAPAFSSNGKKVLWTVMKMPSYQTQLMEMNFENGAWSVPHSPIFGDSSVNDSYPNFSYDGKTLFFSSSRKLNASDTLSKGNRLWQIELKKNKWAQPMLVNGLQSISGIYANSIAKNGNLYLTHGPHRSPDWNILMANKNKLQYLQPQQLAVNSKGYEDGAFVAPNESYLIFESDRQEGIEKSIDLYISFKLKNKQWSDPINMGTSINSSFTERFAKVSNDGKYLFFGSNRNGNFDIYWMDAGIINDLKKQVIKSGL